MKSFNLLECCCTSSVLSCRNIDIENVKKEKNDLSVALRRTKQENKEQHKSFEKEKKQLEKKVFDLNEFRVKILNKEREETIRLRREIKKSNQKMKSDSLKGNLAGSLQFHISIKSHNATEKWP